MKLRVTRARTIQGALRRILLRNDRGIALPMVLLVFILGVALIMTFLVTIIGSSKVTISSKADVQAQAAAEAGVADVLSRLADPATSVCSLATTLIADSTPDYKVTVTFGAPGSWSTACPAGTSQMRIESTGTADGVTQAIERIHSLTVSPQQTFDYDTIIYSGEGWNFQGNANLSSAITGAPADVMIASGDFSCHGNTTIEGSVSVKAGNASFNGGCSVRDNLEVSGDLTSNGTGSVGGDVIVSGSADIGKLSIVGSLTYGIALTSKKNTVGGAINQTPVTIAPAPEWRALNYDRFVAGKFDVVTWTGACEVTSAAHPMVARAATITRATMLDARTCPALTFSGSFTFALGSDLVILAPEISLGDFILASTNTTNRNLYVVSSNTAAGCSSSRTDVSVNKVEFSDNHVAGLLYGECRVTIDGPKKNPWRGSIYSKNVNDKPYLTYVPVADPDRIGGGGTTVPGKIAVEPTPLSVRNISGTS